jgi:hypothetical protein
MKVYWRSGSIAPRIRDHGTRWRRVRNVHTCDSTVRKANRWPKELSQTLNIKSTTLLTILGFASCWLLA